MEAIFLQRLILSSFIQYTSPEIDGEPFLLEEEYFDLPLHKKVVKKLNETILEKKDLFITGLQLEDLISSKGNQATKDEWIEILATNPLPLTVVKKYYKDLERKKTDERI